MWHYERRRRDSDSSSLSSASTDCVVEIHQSQTSSQAGDAADFLTLSTFFSALRNGAKLLERRDDDGFDRLSNRYSVGLIVMMAGFISVKSYVGEPIVCFPPAEFTIQWRKYVDNMCWTTNTYYVPINKDLIPTPPPQGLGSGYKSEYQQEINYYQWVPIILTFCAFMFAIPANVWDWASNTGGYDVEAIVKATKGTSNLNPEVRDKTVKYLVAQMDRLLGYRRPIARKGIMGSIKQQTRVGKRVGCFLFVMYMVTKLLYIANAVLLIYLMDIILGDDNYHYYGIDKIRRLQDPEYKGNMIFPYVTLCDFMVRRMGQNIHKYTVHCVLPVNLFNEKVFVVLWFWLVLVAFLSCIGFILWLGTAFSSVNRGFAKKYLTIMGRATKLSQDNEMLVDFVDNYLRLDGVFCMRLIIKNTNDAIGGEILAACWDHFLQSRKTSFTSTLDEEDLLSRSADSV